MVTQQDISLVRSFNRLVTRQVGALNDRYLGRRPLGEARVLFEIGPDGATPRDVRARLGLDSGYLSRMLGALERDGLIERKPNPADRRSERLGLTEAGRSEVHELDRLSDELAASVLEPLDDGQRARLLAAQAEVRRLLAISMVQIEPRESNVGRCQMVPVALLRRAGRALRGALRSGQDVARRADGSELRPPVRS